MDLIEGLIVFLKLRVNFSSKSTNNDIGLSKSFL